MNINLKPNSPDLVVVPCYTREIEEVQNFLIDKNSIICIKPVEVEIAGGAINVYTGIYLNSYGLVYVPLDMDETINLLSPTLESECKMYLEILNLIGS